MRAKARRGALENAEQFDNAAGLFALHRQNVLQLSWAAARQPDVRCEMPQQSDHLLRSPSCPPGGLAIFETNASSRQSIKHRTLDQPSGRSEMER
jgi:hypothetical protein